MGFGIINTLKREQGLTNAQIAQMSGITLSTLDKITSGVNKNPKLDTLQAICKVLGCTLNDFMDSPPESKSAPSVSSEALQLAQDYDKLDGHGKKIVRVVTDEEMARISAEIKNMREQLEVAQDMIDAKKMPTPVSGDGLTKIFMCFASGLNQGQQQMFQDWLQNMTKLQQQSLLASAPQIVGKTVSKAEPPDQSQ